MSKTKLLILPACLLCPLPMGSSLYSIHQQVLLQNISHNLLPELWSSSACSPFQTPEIKPSPAFLPPYSVVSNQQPERTLNNCKSYHVLLRSDLPSPSPGLKASLTHQHDLQPSPSPPLVSALFLPHAKIPPALEFLLLLLHVPRKLSPGGFMSASSCLLSAHHSGFAWMSPPQRSH